VPSRRDATDLLRSGGALLLVGGAVVLLIRKSGHHEWSAFARLLLALLPAVVLYAIALGGRDPAADDPPEAWRSVLVVVAILLGPLALYELLAWVGASTRHLLYNAGVFALTGLLAAHAARRARVPYAALLAALALLVAWLLVWAKILDHPSANAYRWLLVAGAAVLFVAAAGLARRRATGAGEVATAGGVAAVAAGVLGVIVGAVVGLLRQIGSLITGSGSAASVSRLGSPRQLVKPRSFESLTAHTSGLQHFGWDLYLLLASLALVVIGSRARVRGLGYVGAIGLVAFIISVGAQITRLEFGRAATGTAAGWPIVLVIVGACCLAAPALSRRES
jgi:hypothetical protein